MNNRNQLWILLILGVIISLFATANSDAKQTHQIRYRYIELGTLGGDYSWTTGINNWGQVVGVSELGNGAYRGFLWTAKNKKMKNLGSLDDDLISSTWAINDTGLVVGFSLGLDSQRQAILWDDKSMHPLETLGGTDSDALGINRHGTIVGYSLTSENLYRAAVWDSDGISALDTPEGLESWAWSINTKGDIVGAFITSGIYLRAVVWSKKGVRELGTLGGDESEAFSINDKGDAVGWCSLPENLEWHACLWNRHGDVVDLGTAGGLNSEAYSISDHGQVVGVYYPGESLDVTRAFLWTRKHGMQDLNTLADLPAGTVLVTATGINDFGWITGMNSEDKAYVLIPYKSCSETKSHKDSCRR